MVTTLRCLQWAELLGAARPAARPTARGVKVKDLLLPGLDLFVIYHLPAAEVLSATGRGLWPCSEPLGRVWAACSF